MSVGGDRGDALVVDVARHHRGAEGDGGEDGGLGAGVEALDVGRRVALGVAQALGLGQGLGVVDAVLAHAGEDVVRRPVDDPHHPADALAGQRLPQRADERDGRRPPPPRRAGRRRRPRPPRTGRRRRWPAAPCWPSRPACPPSGRRARGCGPARCRRSPRPPRRPRGRPPPPPASWVRQPGGSADRPLLGQVADGDPGHLEAQPGAGLDGGAWRSTSVTSAAPTLPQPSTPTRTTPVPIGWEGTGTARSDRSGRSSWRSGSPRR